MCRMTNGEHLPQVSSFKFQASLCVQRQSQVQTLAAPYTRRLASLPIIQREQPRKNAKNAKNGKETTKHTKYTNGQSAFRVVCNQHCVSNDQRRTSSTSFKFRVSGITSRPTSVLSPDPSCPVHEASRLVADYPQRPAAKEHKERKDQMVNHEDHEAHERSIGILCRL